MRPFYSGMAAGVIAICVVQGTESAAMSRSTSQEVVLDCLAVDAGVSSSAVEMACAALDAALADTDRNVTRGDSGSAEETGALFGVLNVTREASDFVEASLAWTDFRPGAESAVTLAKTIEVSVQDASVGPATYKQLANGLLTVNPPPE